MNIPYRTVVETISHSYGVIGGETLLTSLFTFLLISMRVNPYKPSSSYIYNSKSSKVERAW